MTARPPQLGQVGSDPVPVQVAGCGEVQISVLIRPAASTGPAVVIGSGASTGNVVSIAPDAWIGPAAGGVPVLLVHGFGSSGQANWSATGWHRTLARAGRTTVTVDLRGHGLSGKPHDSGSYSLPIVLADLREVLAALPALLGPVPWVDLIGYSMGGRLVGELAAALHSSAHDDPLRPDVAVRRGEGAHWAAGLPRVRRVVIGGYDGRPLFADTDPAQFRQALGARPGPDSGGRPIAAIAQADRENDLQALAALVDGLSADRSPLPAVAVQVPTLVVAGERDVITDGTLSWAQSLPAGRHLLVPGRDHISAITSGVFRSAALDFLSG